MFSTVGHTHELLEMTIDMPSLRRKWGSGCWQCCSIYSCL